MDEERRTLARPRVTARLVRRRLQVAFDQWPVHALSILASLRERRADAVHAA
jgi:hypothetical protein